MIHVYYGVDAAGSTNALIDAAAPFRSLSRHAKVLIKPNIVAARSNWLGVNTRPQVVEAVIRRLQDIGVREITVADGSGIGHSASKAFKILGYDAIAGRYGVRLFDIEKDEFISRPTRCSGPFRKLQVSRTVAESDFVINIPVLKAHGETKLTCSLKNLKGVMPKDMKPKFHSVDLHRAIVQLNTVIGADFIFVDGAYGDLSNELGGNPVEMGIMAAGSDPLEIDAFAAASIGFKPSDIIHLAHYADFRGIDLGDYQPEVKELNRPAMQEQFTADTGMLERFPCRVTAEGVCCTCRGNLIFALKRLQERGVLSPGQHFYIGRISGDSAGDFREGRSTRILVGDCAIRMSAKAGSDNLQAPEGSSDRNDSAVIPIPGCPPDPGKIIETLLSI